MVSPTVEVNVVLLSETVVRIGEVVIATGAAPLPVAPVEPDEAPLEAPVLTGTPAPKIMLVGLDEGVALFALEQ